MNEQRNFSSFFLLLSSFNGISIKSNFETAYPSENLQMLSKFLLESLLRLGKERDPLSKTFFKTGNLARKLIVKFYDPITELQSHYIAASSNSPLPQKINIPLSHELPFYIQKYPHYSSNVGRIAALVKQKYEKLTFIDIGANIGDTIYMLRKYASFPIICIEGDPHFFKILLRNAAKFKEVKTVNIFAGDKNRNVQVASSRKSGTGHLEATTGESVKLKTVSEILQAEPSFASSKMMKIDTDGFDGIIIRGALEFIKEKKPVIFLEYDPYFLESNNDSGLAILELLNEAGYKSALFYDNFGKLLTTADLADEPTLKQLDRDVTGKKGTYYYDVCVFHNEDSDLFSGTLEKESAFKTHSSAQ